MKYYDWIAVAVCVVFSIIWQYIYVYKYFHFGFYDWDLALYSQVMWNLAHGSLEPSLFDTNFLTNHSHYIAFVLAPIYFFIQHPLILMFLKIFSFATGAFILFEIAKKDLEPAFATVLMVLYMINPANIFGLLHEFHFESLAIAFIFLAYYSLQSRKYPLFCFAILFLALIKENMPLIVIAFGIYALFSKKHENKLRWGVIPILFGAALFYVSLFVITPYLRADFSTKNQYLGMYASLGSTPFDILRGFITEPHQILKMIFDPVNMSYSYDLFSPLLFLSIFGPHILFLGSPIFLQNFLSSAPQLHNIQFHYASTLMPFIFLASIGPLGFIKRKLRRMFFYIILIMLMLVNCAAWNRYENHLVNDISNLSQKESAAVWRMIEQIPSDGGVVAALNFLDQLSQRKNLQSFLEVARNYNVFTGRLFKLSENINYALIDLRDPWVADEIHNAPEVVTEHLKSFYYDPRWAVIDAYNEIILLKKGQSEGIRLVHNSNYPFISADSQEMITIDNSFELLDVRFEEAPFSRPEVLSLVFNWKALNVTESVYSLHVGVANDENRVQHSRLIGSIFGLTNTWQKGDYIEDRHWFSISDLKPGRYSLFFSVYNIYSGEAVSMVLKNSNSDQQLTNIKFAEITVPAEKG